MTVGTAAIVLAAGFSRRLGQPKPFVMLGGELLLQRAVRLALEADLAPVFVVVRDVHLPLVLPAGVQLVQNDEAAEGMAASVRRGVDAAHGQGMRGAVVLTCDQPLLTVAHLRALCASPEHVTASAYGGKHGVPAYFPAASFAALLGLHGDAGARNLLRGAAAIPNEDLALDIDTVEDLRRAEELFAQRAAKGMR